MRQIWRRLSARHTHDGLSIYRQITRYLLWIVFASKCLATTTSNQKIPLVFFFENWWNNILIRILFSLTITTVILCRGAGVSHAWANKYAWNDDVIKWKHFPRNWPFVRGIHRSPVNSPHKGQWRGALMLSLICTRINGWVNNGDACDLRRHRAHYDVTVIEHRQVAIGTFGICCPHAREHTRFKQMRSIHFADSTRYIRYIYLLSFIVYLFTWSIPLLSLQGLKCTFLVFPFFTMYRWMKCVVCITTLFHVMSTVHALWEMTK